MGPINQAMYAFLVFLIFSMFASASNAEDSLPTPIWKPGDLRRGDDGEIYLDVTSIVEEAADLESSGLHGKPNASQRIREIVDDVTHDYSVDPDLILAIIAVESNFVVDAISHRSAMGLMQLMPATADRYNVKNIFEPADNIRGGVRYMSDLLQRYRGDVTLALAAYNAGEERVDFYNGVPPYPETKNYISRVSTYYNIKEPTVPANHLEVQLDLITMKLKSERARSMNEE